VWNNASAAQVGLQDRLAKLPQFSMQLVGRHFVSLTDKSRQCSADDLRNKRLYAIAGIGDPARFFSQLGNLQLTFEAHAFPDHQRYTKADLAFAEDGVLVMTEKDAVKCAAFITQEAWTLPVEAQIATDTKSLLDIILEKLDGSSPA
jgi:tetraacyldisaccharide 4'-kinase